MRTRGIDILLFAFSLAVLPLRPCLAEDAVVILSGKDARTKATRVGQIVEYTGEALQLKSASGRVETIPAARVVEVRTEWSASHQRGSALRNEGKLEEAVTAFKQAKREELRTWARRQIMADLVSCYAETGRWDIAGDEWLAIAASDPQTLHFQVLPVCWRPFPPGATVESRAASWLKAKLPIAEVLGASWLLMGPQRAEATAALERIAANKLEDPRIRSLAQVQLWRTKLVTAKASDVQGWQSSLEQMPESVRASGYFVLGEVLARLNQPEQGALAFLRIPVVYSEQRTMAADALVAAARLHEQLGRGEQAATLYREVLSGYSRTPAAEEAKARLEKIK